MKNYKNISIVAIAYRLGLKRKGKNFHCFNISAHKHNDRNPSLSINDQCFYCHTCSLKGNGIALIKLVLNCNLDTAYKWLSNNFDNNILPVKDNSLQSKYESQTIKNKQYLDITEVLEAQTFIDTNIFTRKLLELGIDYEHLINWNVGGNSKGETLFFYQNKDHYFINAKKITYEEDLHREKNIPPVFLYTKSQGYGQCLFGEHFLDPVNKNIPVILVESEKTAIISNYCMNNKIWLGTGGVCSLNEEKMKVLKGRKVFVCFDSDLAGRENAKRIQTLLNESNINASIMDLFPDRNDGYDLADYLINRLQELDIKKSCLKPNERELFEERAGILQYQWNVSRYIAELNAFQRLEQYNER